MFISSFFNSSGEIVPAPAKNGNLFIWKEVKYEGLRRTKSLEVPAIKAGQHLLSALADPALFKIAINVIR